MSLIKAEIAPVGITRCGIRPGLVISLLSSLTNLAVLQSFCLVNDLISRTSYRGAFAPENC